MHPRSIHLTGQYLLHLDGQLEYHYHSYPLIGPQHKVLCRHYFRAELLPNYCPSKAETKKVRVRSAGQRKCLEDAFRNINLVSTFTLSAELYQVGWWSWVLCKAQNRWANAFIPVQLQAASKLQTRKIERDQMLLSWQSRSVHSMRSRTSAWHFYDLQRTLRGNGSAITTGIKDRHNAASKAWTPTQRKGLTVLELPRFVQTICLERSIASFSSWDCDLGGARHACKLAENLSIRALALKSQNPQAISLPSPNYIAVEGQIGNPAAGLIVVKIWTQENARLSSLQTSRSAFSFDLLVLSTFLKQLEPLVAHSDYSRYSSYCPSSLSLSLELMPIPGNVDAAALPQVNLAIYEGILDEIGSPLRCWVSDSDLYHCSCSALSSCLTHNQHHQANHNHHLEWQYSHLFILDWIL